MGAILFLAFIGNIQKLAHAVHNIGCQLRTGLAGIARCPGVDSSACKRDEHQDRKEQLQHRDNVPIRMAC